MAAAETEAMDFRGEGASLRTIAVAVAGGLLVLALVYFLYAQFTAVRGVKVEAPSPQIISMVPPPPPPPPPPPQPKEKPPEPTEQPQAPASEAPKAPQPQAAPVSINAPAQAGTDSFGLSAGNGGEIGAPAGGGTCLGTKCGAPAGGGMGENLYRRYLSSALQERVQGDDRISRLVFSADFSLTVTAEGRVSSVQLLDARGRDDAETMKKIAAILEAVRGLDPPPAAMRFPQRITVRGKRAL